MTHNLNNRKRPSLCQFFTLSLLLLLLLLLKAFLLLIIYLFYLSVLPAWYVGLRGNYHHLPVFSTHLFVVNRYTCPDWLLTNVGPLLIITNKKTKKWGLFLSIPIQQNLTTITIHELVYTLLLCCIKLRVLLSNKVFPNLVFWGNTNYIPLRWLIDSICLHSHEHILFFLSFFGFPLCGRIGAARGPAASMICRQKILICGMILLIQRWVPFLRVYSLLAVRLSFLFFLLSFATYNPNIND